MQESYCQHHRFDFTNSKGQDVGSVYHKDIAKT